VIPESARDGITETGRREGGDSKSTHRTREPTHGPPPKILAFAGSTRTESFNKKLVHLAAAGARAAGAKSPSSTCATFRCRCSTKTWEKKERSARERAPV